MKYILQIAGILTLVFFGLNMIFLWTMNGGLWLSSLFIGIILFMSGYWIEEYQRQSLSSFQKARRKTLIRSCIYVIVGCLIVLGLIVAHYS